MRNWAVGGAILNIVGGGRKGHTPDCKGGEG